MVSSVIVVLPLTSIVAEVQRNVVVSSGVERGVVLKER
jgi:hypothetical protein